MSTVKPGCLRRRIVMRALDGGAVAGVEDDFHHFVVTIAHDGDQVVDISASAPRTPWNVCGDAAKMLPQFIGVNLATAPDISRDLIDYHQHCTHQHDLASLAIAQAARGGTRQYDIEVQAPVGKRKAARLYRDGELYWEWLIERSAFVEPARLAGLNLRSIGEWAKANLDDDEREALMVLRRGFMISGGRGIDLDDFADNGRGFESLHGACYAFALPMLGKAKRMKGNSRDFTDAANALLPELEPQPLVLR